MHWTPLALIVLSAFLTACAAPQRASDAPDSARLQRLTRAITEGTFHCVIDNHHTNPDGWAKCDSDGVPVIVLDGANGSCIAMMPFANFEVHVTAQKRKTRIRWYLIAPSGYAFGSHLGAIGIRFEKLVPTDPDWTQVYEDPAFEANGRKFRLDVRKNAPKVSYQSFPVVFGPNSTALAPCRDADPIIINQDN